MNKTGIMVFVIIVGLVLILFKIYLSRGIYQATHSKTATYTYLSISIVSLIAGIWTMYNARMSDVTNNSLTLNIITAFMLTVLITEVFLALFFVLDDLFLIGKWVKNRFSNTENTSEGRRRFIKTIGLGLSTLPFAAYLYGITRGKYNFTVYREEIFFKDLPAAFDGFKVLQLSDMHSGSFDSYDEVKRGLEIVQEQNADLILFTGDLVNDNAHEIEPYIPLMKNLHAPFGKYSVLGNHDYYYDRGQKYNQGEQIENLERLMQYHADMGFHLMNNSNTKLSKGNDYIRLLGVENWGSGFIQKGDIDLALKGTQDDEFSILMSHDPTHWDKKIIHHPRHIHLTLSGHTHGAQMGIETKGLRFSPVQFVYKRWAGLYKELEQYLYINRGFGFLGFAGRVGMNPEITVLTLRKA